MCSQPQKHKLALGIGSQMASQKQIDEKSIQYKHMHLIMKQMIL